MLTFYVCKISKTVESKVSSCVCVLYHCMWWHGGLNVIPDDINYKKMLLMNRLVKNRDKTVQLVKKDLKIMLLHFTIEE